MGSEMKMYMSARQQGRRRLFISGLKKQVVETKAKALALNRKVTLLVCSLNNSKLLEFHTTGKSKGRKVELAKHSGITPDSVYEDD